MLADKLKKLRSDSGMTQAEFADVFSISNGTIAMWETGKRTPDKIGRASCRERV